MRRTFHNTFQLHTYGYDSFVKFVFALLERLRNVWNNGTSVEENGKISVMCMDLSSTRFQWIWKIRYSCSTCFVKTEISVCPYYTLSLLDCVWLGVCLFRRTTEGSYAAASCLFVLTACRADTGYMLYTCPGLPVPVTSVPSPLLKLSTLFSACFSKLNNKMSKLKWPVFRNTRKTGSVELL